jgi:hypothetical protein
MQVVVTWSFSTSCQKIHQHLFVEQVEVCCIPTTFLYLTGRCVCVCVDSWYHLAHQVMSVFLGSWCFYLEEGKMIWKVKGSFGVTLELFCLLTDQIEHLHKNRSTVAVAGAD